MKINIPSPGYRSGYLEVSARNSIGITLNAVNIEIVIFPPFYPNLSKGCVVNDTKDYS